MHQSPPYVSGCAHKHKSQHTNVWYDSEVENPTFPCKEACTLHTCYAAVLDFWIRFGIIQQGKTNIFGLPLFLDTVFSIFKGRNMSWAVEILRLSTQALSLCLPDPQLSNTRIASWIQIIRVIRDDIFCVWHMSELDHQVQTSLLSVRSLHILHLSQCKSPLHRFV